MDTLKRIISILADNKWDYAKQAQITSILGGAKKATLKFGTLSAVFGIAIWESLKSLVKKTHNKFNKQTKKDQDEINSRTESYLSERRKLVEAGESTELLDKEYNEFMEKALGSFDDAE